MRILIRVDAYSDIALGHLNRCLNLGFSLEKHGHSVTFFSYNDPTTQAILSKTHFECEFTPFKINDKQSKREELLQLEVLSDSIDLLLVDSYNVDQSYFDFLNNCFPMIGYLDDLGLDFDVDFVINPSCKVTESDYTAKKVLCGLQYVILGGEYRVGRVKVFSTKKISILVTMGGIDHYNLSSRVIPILEKISLDIEVNIVIGPYYENIKLIRAAVKKSCLMINIFEDVSNLAPIILRSSVALTAGGFTTYELAAMSTPSVGIALWENQYSNIECLSNKDALIPLYYFQEHGFDQELANALFRLVNDNNLLMDMSEKARSAIDGNGVNRISQEITKYCEQR
jgi:UDP-2,4-diacetamido-2,4,6-trideoxy-beta-L-altropyranose hydrolase